MVADGLPHDLASGFIEIVALYRTGGPTACVSRDAEQLLGRPSRTFAEFVSDHRARFTSTGKPAAI